MNRDCRRCEKPGPTERHHIAPRAIFGDLAATFGTVRLCHECHLLWHQTFEQYRPKSRQTTEQERSRSRPVQPKLRRKGHPDNSILERMQEIRWCPITEKVIGVPVHVQ